MLVLSRKVGEQIVIGEDIRVTISKSTGSRVTIAIDAPEDVPIKRAELVQRPPQSDSQGTSNIASHRVAAYRS